MNDASEKELSDIELCYKAMGQLMEKLFSARNAIIAVVVLVLVGVGVGIMLNPNMFK